MSVSVHIPFICVDENLLVFSCILWWLITVSLLWSCRVLCFQLSSEDIEMFLVFSVFWYFFYGERRFWNSDHRAIFCDLEFRIQSLFTSSLKMLTEVGRIIFNGCSTWVKVLRGFDSSLNSTIGNVDYEGRVWGGFACMDQNATCSILVPKTNEGKEEQEQLGVMQTPRKNLCVMLALGFT
jgi:hypothetical protein